MSNQKVAAPCLVIFCKRPALSQGKQRLAKTIGAKQALIFSQAFLDCALEDARAWRGSGHRNGYGPVVLSPSLPDDRDWASKLLDQDTLVLVQPEGRLGHRLQAIDQELRTHGHDKIIFLGTDVPMLKPHHFNAAAQALLSRDIVLSPALDGGVTLMGARLPWPDLTALPWSSDQLGQALEKQCRDNELTVENIATSYDIDVEADLIKLQGDLVDDPRPARKFLYRLVSDFMARDKVNYG